MKICVECRYPVQQLYTTYSKADDRSLGKGVRLTQCPRCKRFADKYVEHDFVVLFIDLVLIKPQVYRHLLFNRLGREDDRFDPSIIRLGILLLLFDVYLTWARIEKASPSASSRPPNTTFQPQFSLLSSQPLVFQYLFFLFLCTVTTLAFHTPIRLLCAHPPSFLAYRADTGNASATATNSQHQQQHPHPVNTPPTHSSQQSPQLSWKASLRRPLGLIPFYPHPASLSTALLVSSCTKLFPILLIVWEYDLPSSASAVSWAVIVNNVAALEILMGCGYLRAAALVCVGTACRVVVGWVVLRAVGLSGVGLGVRGLMA